jgi:hypothetical protein
VWTINSSWRSRSSRETAAALTNCGRLPMTVRIRMVGARRARALATLAEG